MERAGKILLASLLAFALVPAAAAQDFSVSVDVQNPAVRPATGEDAKFMIHITNNADVTGHYTLDYIVSNPGWYFLPQYTMTLPPGETGTAVLYAEPGEEAIEGNVGVILRISGDGNEVVKRPSYRIVRDNELIIQNMETGKTVYGPSSPVNVSLKLKNVVNRELGGNAYHAVISLGNEGKTVSVPSMDPGDEETVMASFRLGQYVSGVKSIDARVESLQGVLQDTETLQVRVEETQKIIERRSESFNLLTSTRTITVSNEGNVDSDPTTVSANLPFYLGYFTSFEPDPDSTSSQGMSTVYEWRIEALEPGSSVSVGYTVNYWAPVLLVLLLAAAVYLAVREYMSPHVVKKVYRKEGNQTIHLRVENRSRRELENVVVKDFVPSIASLIEKFDSSPPERIREGEEATELEWRLGRLEPGEERILTYRISPQVAVEGGSVTLPSAHLEYEARGREKKRHSHPARADFS
ncbi:MAG: hypothetical protein ABEJ62_02395 [Candidatus Nanohaloarchaea archaeon]